MNSSELLKVHLPKLFELYSKHSDDDPDNFFSGLPSRLGGGTQAVTFQYYLRYEKCLGYISTSDWPYFTGKIGESCKNRQGGLWKQLHHRLNEAFGVEFLKNQGFCDVRFVPEGVSTKKGCAPKTPDLTAVRRNENCIAEVKTIDTSDIEDRYWKNLASLATTDGEDDTPSQPPKLLTTFPTASIERKVVEKYETALRQIREYAELREMKCYTKCVVLVVNLDTTVDAGPSSIKADMRQILNRVSRPDCPIHAIDISVQ